MTIDADNIFLSSWSTFSSSQHARLPFINKSKKASWDTNETKRPQQMVESWQKHKYNSNNKSLACPTGCPLPLVLFITAFQCLFICLLQGQSMAMNISIHIQDVNMPEVAILFIYIYEGCRLGLSSTLPASRNIQPIIMAGCVIVTKCNQLFSCTWAHIVF